MTIQIIDKGNWMYFWIKTIEDIDLNNHCAKTFIGKYLNGDNIETKIKDVYICGVSNPFKYEDNLHLALKEKVGNDIEIKKLGVHIMIKDAELIEIKPLNKGESLHAKGSIKQYYTCRNWQYANQLKI
jgi:hypothetical protein